MKKINNSIKNVEKKPISLIMLLTSCLIITLLFYYNEVNASIFNLINKNKNKEFEYDFLNQDEIEKLLYLFNFNKERINHIIFYSKKNDISPFLTSAVIFAESDNKEKAISSANARGLMQLMHSTAIILLNSMGDYELLNKVKQNPDLLYDVELNISLGTKFLRDLRNFHKDWYETLHSYNVGPYAFKMGKRNFIYVNKIMSIYNDFQKMKLKEINKKYGQYISNLYAKKIELLALK